MFDINVLVSAIVLYIYIYYYVIISVTEKGVVLERG